MRKKIDNCHFSDVESKKDGAKEEMNVSRLQKLTQLPT